MTERSIMAVAAAEAALEMMVLVDGICNWKILLMDILRTGSEESTEDLFLELDWFPSSFFLEELLNCVLLVSWRIWCDSPSSFVVYLRLFGYDYE